MSVFRPVPTEQVRAATEWQETVLGLVKSRIVNFRVAPTRPAVGEPVTISGELQHHVWPWCTYAGVKKYRPIDLLVDDIIVDSTEAVPPTGGFRFTHYFTEVGKHWVKARFPGAIDLSPSESPEVLVTVLTEEEKKEEEMRWWMMVGGIAAVVVVTIGGVAWYTEESRRREMMIAMMRR